MARTPDRRAAAAAILVVALLAGPAGADLAADLQACAGLEADAPRLACFDRVAAVPRGGAAFEGFGNGETEVFETTGPASLVYASDDAVLVIYLMTEAGELIHNLHIGGAGEARHPLTAPGRYRLQVDATGGWRVRIEPAAP